MPADYGVRTPLQLAWLATAAALVVAMLIGGGWLAWRGMTAAAGRPATGSAATTLPADATGAVAFGAPEVVDGVPWGYPPTADGAAAAAVTAVAVTGQPEAVFDAERFDEVAAVVFEPDVAGEQAGQVDAARAQLELSGWNDQPPSRRTYHFAPLAVRMVAFDPSGLTARAEVWSMTLMGVGDAGGAVFTTSTVDLVAPAGGTWQVTGLDSIEGPIPMVVESASAPGRTRALLRDAVATLPLPVGEWP